jgi:hypothetical protein
MFNVKFFILICLASLLTNSTVFAMTPQLCATVITVETQDPIYITGINKIAFYRAAKELNKLIEQTPGVETTPVDTSSVVKIVSTFINIIKRNLSNLSETEFNKVFHDWCEYRLKTTGYFPGVSHLEDIHKTSLYEKILKGTPTNSVELINYLKESSYGSNIYGNAVSSLVGRIPMLSYGNISKNDVSYIQKTLLNDFFIGLCFHQIVKMHKVILAKPDMKRTFDMVEDTIVTLNEEAGLSQ